MRWSILRATFVPWCTREENEDAIHEAIYGGDVRRLNLGREHTRPDSSRIASARVFRRSTTRAQRLWDALAGACED